MPSRPIETHGAEARPYGSPPGAHMLNGSACCETPGHPAVERRGRHQCVCAAIRPAVLLPDGDLVGGAGRVDGVERLDLGVRVDGAAGGGRGACGDRTRNDRHDRGKGRKRSGGRRECKKLSRLRMQSRAGACQQKPLHRRRFRGPPSPPSTRPACRSGSARSQLESRE